MRMYFLLFHSMIELTTLSYHTMTIDPLYLAYNCKIVVISLPPNPLSSFSYSISM